MAAPTNLVYPAVVAYYNDDRRMTLTELASALTWIADRLNDDRIGANPVRRHGYVTDDVVTYNEWAAMTEDAPPMEQGTLSWVGHFDDKQEELVRSQFHDEALWERLYEPENMRRGRVLAMGKGYQTAFSQSFPLHLPRTYMVLNGEVCIIIYVCHCCRMLTIAGYINIALFC
jgi:hypothetical protein